MENKKLAKYLNKTLKKQQKALKKFKGSNLKGEAKNVPDKDNTADDIENTNLIDQDQVTQEKKKKDKKTSSLVDAFKRETTEKCFICEEILNDNEEVVKCKKC